MTYKFDNFKTEITDPKVTVVTVMDNIHSKQCAVEVLLSTETAKFGIVLSGFSYGDTWEDAAIEKWVKEELTKHKI